MTPTFNDAAPNVIHLNSVYEPLPFSSETNVYMERHSDTPEARIETIALAFLILRPKKIFITNAKKGNTGIKCANLTISSN